ncbi:acyl-phosphate glycerol 3-phosphate acyltransferase [Halovibrio salipaludis]|uniref:Glycerol-3-phosphate acyltransferase n=1 Tax=Halovibrio salipaludis TaxID=2032626 RepID=A0A2A2EXG7_9GAMM|nr:glycerol-3-phosphate 1-O-acyltransferase PlsY [Halovibrio salipaludis]PAU77067.1 acyl-phosphate glycerol 3-phosphate acyltransferase [Halovibrio salipaludis]
MELLFALLLCALGYLSGSILFAPLVCQLLNAPPPHLYGSRNPGATNVYRIAGPGPAGLTLLGDALKGWAPVTLAQYLDVSPATQAAVALAAIAGHMLPAFSRFRGGKGVATTLGTGLALAAGTILTMALIWLLVFRQWRIASLASIVAAGSGPVFAFLLNPPHTGVFLVIALVLFVRHRDNLVRLAQGSESHL